MEESILTTIMSFAEYGIAGLFLILFIYVIFQQNKKYEILQKEFREHITTSNEKLFTVIDKNTTVFDKIVVSLDNNTTVNKHFSEMVEKKLDLLDIIRKTK